MGSGLEVPVLGVPDEKLALGPGVAVDCVALVSTGSPREPKGFQGNDIPVDGEVVARLIHSRLTLDEEEIDSED